MDRIFSPMNEVAKVNCKRLRSFQRRIEMKGIFMELRPATAPINANSHKDQSNKISLRGVC